MKWVGQTRHVLLLSAVAVGAVGCAATLPMDAEVASGNPHTTIPYTGVRNDAARFEDYSVIDEGVLGPAAKRGDPIWPWR